MKINWRPSFILLAITFMSLALIFFGCFLPAIGFDEGTNPDGEICYKILEIITLPLSFTRSLVVGWFLFYFIILLDLIIWALVISVIIKLGFSLLKLRKN